MMRALAWGKPRRQAGPGVLAEPSEMLRAALLDLFRPGAGEGKRARGGVS